MRSGIGTTRPSRGGKKKETQKLTEEVLAGEKMTTQSGILMETQLGKTEEAKPGAEKETQTGVPSIPVAKARRAARKAKARKAETPQPTKHGSQTARRDVTSVEDKDTNGPSVERGLHQTEKPTVIRDRQVITTTVLST